MAQATDIRRYEKIARWLHNNHLFQAWLVLMLAIVFGTCLAAVHINLSGRIAENKLNESLERIPGLDLERGGKRQTVAMELVEFFPGELPLQKRNGPFIYPVFQVKDEGETGRLGDQGCRAGICRHPLNCCLA